MPVRAMTPIEPATAVPLAKMARTTESLINAEENNVITANEAHALVSRSVSIDFHVPISVFYLAPTHPSQCTRAHCAPFHVCNLWPRVQYLFPATGARPD